MEETKKYIRMLLNILIPLAAVFVVCFWGPKLLRFFWPFVVGWLIAMMTNPLVKFLEKRLKIVRKHSSVMIVVLALALVIGLLYLLITRIVIETAGLIQDLPELYNSLSQELQAVFMRFDHLFARLPSETQEYLHEVTSNIGSYISLLVQKAASPTVEAAGTVAKGIPGLLVYSIITILSSYFFIAEQDKILEFWKKHVPSDGSKYMSFLKRDVKKLIGGYFLAQFRIMFVVALILAAGFLILGVPHGLLFAVLISLLDFLPLFGTGTALFPWALVKLISGEYAFAVGLILIYILTQVVRQIIQPKIVGDTMGLPPLMTLFFLYLGFKVGGISGMILAVPLGMLALKFYEYGVFDSFFDNLNQLIREIDRFRKNG
ncbi:MAG: sporulation integral membrane protein YtvI [Lachnospiraceae bacterium]